MYTSDTSHFELNPFEQLWTAMTSIAFDFGVKAQALYRE